MANPLPQDDGRDAEALWQLCRDGDREARDLLFARHLAYCNRLVGLRAKKMPLWMDRDLLASAAHKGLLDAIEKFDPDRGRRFISFAYQKIHGHMTDAIRDNDPNGRRALDVRRKRNQIEEQLQKAGRPHHDAAVSAMIPQRDQASDKAFRLTGSLSAVISQPNSGQGRPVTLGDLLAGPEIDHAVDRDERIRETLRGLSFDDQVLLYCKYWKGATMKQLGKLFGISESRISQLHSQLIERLRQRGDRVKESLR